jgi:hypothetical protein
MMDRDERAEKLTSTVSGNSSSGLTTHSSMDTERVGHPGAMQRKAPEGGDVESPKVPYTEVRDARDVTYNADIAGAAACRCGIGTLLMERLLAKQPSRCCTLP